MSAMHSRPNPASLRVNDVHNQGPELLDPEALPANYQMELIPSA